MLPILLIGLAGAAAYSVKNIIDKKDIEKEIENIKAKIEQEDKQTQQELIKALGLFTKAMYEAKTKFEGFAAERYQKLLDEFSRIKRIETIIPEINMNTIKEYSNEISKRVKDLKTITLNLEKQGKGISAEEIAKISALSVLGGVGSALAVGALLNENDDEEGSSLLTPQAALAGVVVGLGVAALLWPYTSKKQKEEELEKLKQEKAQMEVIFEERRSMSQILLKMENYMTAYTRFLDELSEIVKVEIQVVKQIIQKFGVDAKSYPSEILDRVAKTFKVLSICHKSSSLNPIIKYFKYFKEQPNELQIDDEFIPALNGVNEELQQLKPMLLQQTY